MRNSRASSPATERPQRALHKMEQEGLIELGYRCIRILPALNNLDALAADACAQFHMPPKT